MNTTTSRRAILAGAAALTGGVAVNAAAILTTNTATAAPGLLAGYDHRATLARFEKMIDVLRNCVICDGWKLDDEWERAAARALRYFQRCVVVGFPADGCDEEQAAIEFVSHNGQSHDWISGGDPGGMICSRAATSRRFATLDPVLGLIDAHRAAEAARDDALTRHDHLFETLPDEFAHDPWTPVPLLETPAGLDEYHGPIRGREEFLRKLMIRRCHDEAEIRAALPAWCSNPDEAVQIGLKHIEDERKRLAAAHEAHGLTAAKAHIEVARERARDALWSLASTPAASLAGLAALFAYARERGSFGNLICDDELSELVEWTIECSICALAGLPVPAVSDVVADLLADDAVVQS